MGVAEVVDSEVDIDARSLDGVWIVGLAVLGFFMPATLLIFGVWSAGEPPGELTPQEFLLRPEAVIWMASLGVTFAVVPILWADLAAATWPLLRHSSRRDWRWAVGLSALLMVGFLVPNAVSQALVDHEQIPLGDAGARTFSLSVLAAFGFLLPAGIALAMSAQAASNALTADLDHQYRQYVAARDVSKRAIGWLSLGLSLMVVVYAAFREVVILVEAAQPEDYPVSLLLTAAAFSTALVALAYFSTARPITRLGLTIRDHLAPMPDLSTTGWQAAVEVRQQATAALELDVPASRRFSAALSVSAPFVSGLVASLLGTSS